MRRFRFSDPGFDGAFRTFIDERRDSPPEVDAIAEAVRTTVGVPVEAYGGTAG